MSRLLIIPARSKSKRIPNKNIKKFFGKPIILYTIDCALKSKLFKEIHISTNDTKIKKIVEKKILIKFLRPKKLSNDKTPLLNVIKYVANKYKLKNKISSEIWIMLPCSPLIIPKDLISASKILKSKKSHNAVMSVSKFSPPIQWAFKINKSGILTAVSSKFQKSDSKNLNDHYFDTGNFIGYKSKAIYNNQKFKFKSYYIPKNRASDIDNKEDWEFTKILYKELCKK
jgi:pseudaminic acid cytidylyltransferase